MTSMIKIVAMGKRNHSIKLILQFMMMILLILKTRKEEEKKFQVVIILCTDEMPSRESPEENNYLRAPSAPLKMHAFLGTTEEGKHPETYADQEMSALSKTNSEKGVVF